MSLIDTQNFNITCGECAHKFPQSVGDLKLNDRMTICPECGNRHQLDKAGFEAAVSEGEKQIEDLQAKVRSIGENLFKGGK